MTEGWKKTKGRGVTLGIRPPTMFSAAAHTIPWVQTHCTHTYTHAHSQTMASPQATPGWLWPPTLFFLILYAVFLLFSFTCHIRFLFFFVSISIPPSCSLFFPFDPVYLPFSSYFFHFTALIRSLFLSLIHSFSSYSTLFSFYLFFFPPFRAVINFPIPCVLSPCLPSSLALALPLPFASFIFAPPPLASFSFCLSSSLLTVISLINFLIFSSLRLSFSLLSLSVPASLSAAGLPCSGLSVISLIHHHH